MSAITTDEVVNAFDDLADMIEKRLSGVGASTRPSIHGDQAAQIIAECCRRVAAGLLAGRYGP